MEKMDLMKTQNKSPGQRCIQHPWVRYPNHSDHLGQTIKDHTWAPHEELLEHDQSYECYQEFQWKGTIHHADKIFQIQPSKEGEEKVNI